MNEFEKDENSLASEEINEEATEEVIEEKEAEGSEKAELQEELEEIRDMFQRELNKASEEPEGGELIQELEYSEEGAAEEAEEEIDPALLCECCGENKKAEEFGEDYPYCESCREAMKKYPLRWSGVVAVLVAIVLFGATAYFSGSALEGSLSAGSAAIIFDTGKVYSALQSSYSYLSSVTDKDAVSMKLVKKVIDGYMKTGYVNDAVNLIETYFSEEALKLPWNKKYKDIVNEGEIIEKTYYAVSDVIEPVAAGKDFDYDEVIAELEAMKAEHIDENDETSPLYDEIFIEYYKYVVMSVSEKSLEEQMAQLKKLDEIGEGFEWVYLSNYISVAAKLSDFETVQSAFERAMDINLEDSAAYTALASYYRYLETPDPEKILEVCEKAKENAYGGDLSYKQYEAIAYLLKGEGTMALEAMEEYMASSGYTIQMCNLYALCGLYNGDEEIYNEMKELLENSGYEISELVQKYKDNDKIKVAEILADKGGDI